MIAPASRSFCTMNASSGGIDPASATLPAVVGSSAVSMLSLRRIGMPYSGPFWLPGCRRASTCAA
jgi:hypothetical protein